ncbi:STAS/SEC14 domain-containing protein [Adhaeribacter arboris]|uniref:STAS/SEC14 domain-containing protein n=1 Tax=Adhaeribacter arboris TaxID=2072846 RepID=A0A2T2YC27_9BACT|nr:STAS/SEC14 domain-containing protein [Adhaeribacter arboris]PSR53080.1 STAS/SEC14 domain-containing protein [Adhaeribacter arboris]
MLATNDRPLIKGEIADYWLDEEGILYSYSKNPKRTVKNISENVALVKQITGNKKVPLLIYLSNSPVPDKETRRYSTEQLPEIYKAMAMVSKPGLAQFILNVLFKFKSPLIPTQSFSDDQQAREWLKQFL